MNDKNFDYEYVCKCILVLNILKEDIAII